MNPKAVNLYNKALTLIKSNKLSQARNNLDKAIKIDSSFFQAHTSLGTIFERQGLHERALSCYLTANKLLPNNAIILNNIGNSYSKLNNLVESKSFYNRAMQADPNYPYPIFNLLSVEIRLSQFEDAYANIISKKSNDVIFLILIAIFLNSVKLKSIPEYQAIKDIGLNLSKAFNINTENKEQLILLLQRSSFDNCPLYNLITYLSHQRERHYKIFKEFLIDVSGEVDSCKITYNYFRALDQLEKGNYEISIKHIKNAINEGCSDAQKTPLVDALYQLNKLDEAYEILLPIKDKIFPSPSTAALFFRKHDFKNGWKHYQGTEENFKHICLNEINIDKIRDKSILLLSNQGVGDVILFLSCLNDFIKVALPKRVTLNCDARLHEIIRRSFTTVEPIWDAELFDPRLITKDYKTVAEHNYCLKLSSICGITRQSLDNFHLDALFLKYESSLRKLYGEKLNNLKNNLSIGIAWTGGALGKVIKKKEIGLESFIPLLKISNINWINLQYGNVEKEINLLNQSYGTNLIHFDEIDPMQEIERQIALIANLDLIIQTSNTSIHFAGSQAVPAWVLLDEPGDFRWFSNGVDEQSAWYSSVRMIKKEQKQSWEELVESLVPELTALAASKL